MDSTLMTKSPGDTEEYNTSQSDVHKDYQTKRFCECCIGYFDISVGKLLPEEGPDWTKTFQMIMFLRS